MSKDNSFESETEEKGSESSSEETETGEKTLNISDYENLRLKRMAENKARMEAMGLHKMAASLMGSAQTKEKNNKKDKKGKRKVNEEDDDYKPEEEDETMGFLSGDDDDESGDSPVTKFKKKRSSTSSKKVATRNVSGNSDYVDVDVDDDALMQAIALSLQGSAGFLDVVDHGPSRSPHTHLKDSDVDKRREISPIKEDTGRRKKKKPTSSRVQMTEDELILHFFQFDGAGQGSITLQDLRRVAAGHDFTWSDKEMADMVHIFDTDGDGKLSLEDFRKIVGRCNMIQAVMGAKSD